MYMMNRIKYFYSRFGITGLISAIKAKLGSSNNLIIVQRKDLKAQLYLRIGTSDLTVFDQIFVNQEYNFATNNPPEIIVDAGANIGLSAILFANRYPKSKIIAIEPEESNFQLLKTNVASYGNIIPLQAALWDKNEKICLVDPSVGKWGFRTEEKERNEEQLHGGFCHHIDGITVDRIMQNYDLQRIDILKIDIEGAEKEVFDDTSSWIEKVDAIIIELHERMKPGCNRSFYNGSNGFDEEWLQGENIYLSRKNCLRRLT
jgi:FkbM family methyltransferase